MTSVHNPYDTFTERINDCNNQLNVLKNKLKWLTTSRLATFLLMAVLTIYFLSVNNGIALLISLTLLVPAFVWLVARYQRCKTDTLLTEQLKSINQLEIQRLDGIYLDIADGLKHLDIDHPFAQDLDLFGAPSLFQLLNRTTTEKGEYKLVHAMLNHLNDEKTSPRQEALKELSIDLKFRQQVQALGLYFQSKDEKARTERDDESLNAWIQAPEHIGNRAILKAFNIISPAVMIVVMLIFSSYAFHIFFGFALWHYAIMLGYVSKVNNMSRSVSDSLNLIKTYKEIILKFENHKVKSNELADLQFCRIFP